MNALAGGLILSCLIGFTTTLVPTVSFASTTIGDTNIEASGNNLNVNDGACLLVTIPSDWAYMDSISAYLTGSASSYKVGIWATSAGVPTGSPLTLDDVGPISASTWYTASDATSLTIGQTYCVGIQSLSLGVDYYFAGPSGGGFYALSGTAPISSYSNSYPSGGGGTLGSFYITYEQSTSTPPAPSTNATTTPQTLFTVSWLIFTDWVVFCSTLALTLWVFQIIV